MAASSAASASSDASAVVVPMTRITVPDADNVKTFLDASVKYIKMWYLTPTNLAQKIKYIVDDETGDCLSNIQIDVGRMVRALVDDGFMSSSEKNKAYQDAGLILTYNINTFLDRVQALSSDIITSGWKIEKVFPSIFNHYRFNGNKKDGDKKGPPIYGAGDFSLILSLNTDTTARASPLCNNNMRESTPMRVSCVISEVSDSAVRRGKKGNKEEGASPPSFKKPHPSPRAALIAPNPAYVETISSSMVDHMTKGGAFAARSLKYIVDNAGACVTNARINFSAPVEHAVYNALPASFFRVTQNEDGEPLFPSNPAQQVVRGLTCEASLRFLSNFPAIVTSLCDKLETAFPTIGWRARSIEVMVYDPMRFFGKTAEMGGSATFFNVPLEPCRKDLEGLICSNTAKDGFPAVKKDTPSSPDSWAAKAGGGTSKPSVHKTYSGKPVTSGVTGRK